MGRDELKEQIALRFESLRSAKWPTGAARISSIGDADVDLAELDGFVAGLVSTYLENAKLRYDRIPLSRKLAATFSTSLPAEAQEGLIEPYRRRWRLLLELSELLAKTGKVRIEWED